MPAQTVQPDGSIVDPTRSITAQQQDQVAHPSGAATNLALGLPFYIYGDSLTIMPPVAGTYGRDWINLLKKDLKFDRIFSYGIGGSDSIGVAYHMVNGTSGAGLPTAVPGAKWDGTRRGIVALSTNLNDATATADRFTGGKIAVGVMGNDALSGYVGAYRAILAILSSASRVEVEAATLTGTGWTTNNAGAMSGGVSKYTSVPGDKATFNVTVPASGRVHIIMHALDPNQFSVPSADVAVDGTLVKSVSQATLTMRGQKSGASTVIGIAPCAIEVKASPGAHTISVTHTGAAGSMLSLDFVAIPAASPPPIFAAIEYDIIAGAYSQAEVDQITANRKILDPAYLSVMAEFPNVTPLRLTMDPQGLSTADKIHPNDKGHVSLAAQWKAAILKGLQTATPDNLFFNLGALLSPQLTSAIAQGVWPGGTATDVKFATKMQVCIYGGVVTVIAIDGVATGLTSGTFIVKEGHRMAVTFSSAPNYTSWDVD